MSYDVEQKSEKAKRRNCSSRFTRWAAEMAESTVTYGTWATKRVAEGVSGIFEYGKPVAVFVVTQLPQAVDAASYCFSMPGSNQTFRLDCCDQNQLSNLSRDLHLQGGAIPQLPHSCDTQYNQSLAVGTTPWRFNACELRYNQNSTQVNGILVRNIQNGVWCPADTSATVGTTIGAFFALLIVGGCVFCCYRRRQKQRANQRYAPRVERRDAADSSVDREALPPDHSSYQDLAKAADRIAGATLGDSRDGNTTSVDGEVTYVETDRAPAGRGRGTSGYQGFGRGGH